jgi:predicted DNA-binding protein
MDNDTAIKGEVTEDQRREALNKILNSFSRMETERWGTIVFRHPTIDESARADMQYSKSFQNLVEEGVRTNAQWRKWMREQGVFTREDEKRIRTLGQEMQALSTALVDTEGDEAREAIEKQIEDISDEMQELYMEQQAFLQHSAESKAEEGRLMQLILCCVENEDGEPIWPNQEALLAEDNDQQTIEVTAGLMRFLRGIPLELLEDSLGVTETPEEIGAADGKSPDEQAPPYSGGQSPNGTVTE